MSNSSSSRAVRDLAYIAVFAALIIACGPVSIPTAIGVPFVIQNALVTLTGVILGARRGFLSVALFLGLGLFGLPVLSAGKNTLTALAGPSVGYIVGYLVSVVVAGAIAYSFLRKGKGNKFVGLAIAAFSGLLTQYLCGMIGLMIKNQLSLAAAATAQVPYLLPDILKIVLVVGVAVAVHKAFPNLAAKRASLP